MKSNFKKSISLLLAALMMLSAVSMMFTSCSSEEEEVTADIGETISTRKPITLTLYGVTGETTTPEAIKEVEKHLNRLTESEYSTTLVLKLYNEAEYEQVLEDAYIKLQHEADVAEFCEGAKKIGDRINKKRDKLLTEEEANAKTEAEKKAKEEEAERAAKEAEELAAAIEAGEAEAEPIKENQIDIMLINDFEHYMNSINHIKGYEENKDGEQEAVIEPVIIPLDSYLKLNSKILTDYIHPTLLSASKIGGSTYGLPVNKGIDAQATYYVIDKELVEKYSFDTTQLTNFANIEYFLADVKANEPDVIPLLRAPEEVQGYDFYNDEIGHPIGHPNPEFGEYAPTNCRSTFSDFSVTNFFEIMSDFREYGYLPEIGADTNGVRFAVDIRKGSDEDVKKWEEEGYIVEVYKTARATTENTLGAMYAISAYSDYPDRCMEILEMLYTNKEFKNIYTFGVETTDGKDGNYKVNEDGKTVTRINDTYVMDFMKSGNTFIGLLDEGMDADYVEKAVKKNFGVKRHGFLAFQLKLTAEEQEAYDWYIEQAGDTFEQLRQGVENPDITYQRIAGRLKKGFTAGETVIPGITDFIVGADDVPSKWGLEFETYKTTIPPTVTFDATKDLSVYMAENKNE